LFIEDEFSGNLLEKLRKNLSKRKTGNPARFLFDSETPPDLLKILKLAFNLSTNDFVEGGRYLNFNDFFSFPNPMSPKFEITQWRQLKHQTFEKYDSILRAVHENDILLHFPYHTYDYVLRFLNEAALDPKVEEIKTTQYRLAKNSAIVNTLITAARNDKKVTVFVEIKARFDEEANISFSDQMKAAGINVIAGIPGLKVHAKAALIIRKSTRPSKKRGYAFVSTGNFNEKTAQLYSDHGLFTTKDEIIDDLKKMFEYLETPHDNYKFEHILVPRFNLIKELNKKISREEEIVKNGGKGYIIMKMNGLEEKDIIEKFYEASIKGVKIDLIVRGICCLKTNQAFSKNITVTRIVDRYLEHSRIFYFHNNGKSEIYISSADLMFRNMHRRVESTIPIYDEGIKKEIIDFLEMQLKDNTHARFIDKNNNNIEKISNLENIKYQAQIDTYLYLEKKLMLGV